MTRLSILCALLLVLSGLSLVSSQYRARQLFTDLDRAQNTAKRLNVDWTTLQLEQTNFSKQSLVEAAAVRDLGMHRVLPGQIKYITLPERVAGYRDVQPVATLGDAAAPVAGAVPRGRDEPAAAPPASKGAR